MTEDEWLNCTDPDKLPPMLPEKVSVRKALLVGAAAYRLGRVWTRTRQQLANQQHELGDARRTVELAERLADELVNYEQARPEDWRIGGVGR